MDHPHPFKTEPVFADSDDQRERLVYGDMSGVNYAMKPEPYTTCGQPPNGLHYGQEGYTGHHDGQNGHLNDPNYKSDRHVPIYHHPSGCGVPPEMYTEQPQSHHTQGAQLQQSWRSELSPTASTSGSEDNWDGSAVMHNRAPSSVSLTLPEVQSGAATAMAYANLYRGKNDATERESKCKAEGAIQNGHLDTSRSNSISYTELVPRKGQTGLQDAQNSNSQSVSIYQDLKSKTRHSPSRPRTGSVSPHQMRTDSEDKGSPHITWLESAASLGSGKRKSAEQSVDVGGKIRKMSSSPGDGNHGNALRKSEQLRLVQELVDNFLPLEKVVTYQWQAYQQSYGEVS